MDVMIFKHGINIFIDVFKLVKVTGGLKIKATTDRSSLNCDVHTDGKSKLEAGWKSKSST